jgi:glutamate synthase (ferredoxin)
VSIQSNGRTVGACLDRNGLRPARYWKTKDGLIYVASEVGVLDIKDSEILMKGRLGPGMMISVNLETGEVFIRVMLCSWFLKYFLWCSAPLH